MPRSVLYIAGLGRSGSTLLARLLGEVSGVFNAGECVRYLFTSHMYQLDIPCSCGLSPLDCEFWGMITPLVSDDDRQVATDLLRIRNLVPWTPSNEARLSVLRERAADIYEQVAERAGGDLIVDSSKHPAIARLIAGSERIETHVLHLVRDPRGVVASRRQPKSYLRAINPGLMTGRWIGFNIASEALRRYVASYSLVRYEDFVGRPAETIEVVLRNVDGRRAQLDFIEGRHAMVTGQHALAGNPDKLEDGKVTIQQGSVSLPRSTQWAITTATLPLLLRYGYPLRTAAG